MPGTDIEGAPRMLREDEARAVYAILIIRAGARDDDDLLYSFVDYASKTRDVEWRFMGKLGFGGKLYFDGYSVPHVSCYRENETPERLRIIEATNTALCAMFQPPGGSHAEPR